MKECSKCKKIKDLKSFNKNKNTKDSYTVKCSECIREYSKQHYKDNKEKYFAKYKNRREKRYKWFEEYKSTLSCEVCSENHIAVLDFHHKDPTKKDFGVAEGFMRLNKSKKDILREISKCIIFCSNCHRKYHYNEKQKLKNKKL
jgi:hypothetical protein